MSGIINLTGAEDPILTFWHKYDIASSTGGHDQEWDYGRVYISDNYGLPGTWAQLYGVYGSSTSDWQRVDIDLSAYVGKSTVRLRFVMDDQRDQDPSWGGDNSEARDGWWIDDIRVENRPAKVTLASPANVSMHGATLSWTQNSDSDFKQYEIYRATNASIDRTDQLIATITSRSTTSYRDEYSILQPSQYYYRMYVIDSLNIVSVGSNIVGAPYSVPTVLFPFVDSVEVAADTAKWTWGSPWGRTAGRSHSGLYSWTESPASSYGPNANTSLSTFVNLSLSTSPVLTFWHSYALEEAADYGIVEVSTDAGTTWSPIHSVTGVDTSWNQERIDLSAYIGGMIGLRFRLSSNATTQLDGWYIDDIRILNGVLIVSYPFSDNMESGNPGYFMDSPWGITTTTAHSSPSSWSDSPAGSYANNSDASLRLRINLATAQMPVLQFWTRFATEVNVDYCRVEVSSGGSGWTIAGYWTGSQSTWKLVKIDLTPWAGGSDVRIRWRFTSSGSTVSDGWYIDDISIAETPTPSLGYPFIDGFEDSTSTTRWHFTQWETITGGRTGQLRIHDSPTGYYLQSGGSGASDDPNSFTSFTSSGVIDLSRSVSPILSFWHKYDFATSTGGHDQEWDYGRVYISSNYGLPGTWTQLYGVNGTSTSSWTRVDLSLSSYVGRPNVRIRFVVDDQRDQDPSWGGDNSEAREGWWIDDIRVGENLSAAAVVDSTYLERPLWTTSTPGKPSERIYGLVYEGGKTNAAGQGAGVSAQLGLGANGSYPNDTTWTWINATYLNDAGNYDRYFASLTAPSVGQYDYAFRFSLDTGKTWIYADADGNFEGTNSANGYSPDKGGDLVISNRPDLQLFIDTVSVYLAVGARQNWSFYLGNTGVDAQGPLGFNLVESTDGTNPTEVVWYAINTRSGAVNPTNRVVITLTFDATGLKADTTYRAFLLVNSNDPNRSQVSVPIRLRTVAAGTVMLDGLVTDIAGARITSFARVEVYQSSTLITSVSSDANGNYSVFGLSAGTYDLRVCAEGYYPRKVSGFVLPTSAVNVALSRVPAVALTNKSINVYSSNTLLGGVAVRPGDVVTAVDPNGVNCGVFTVNTAGRYGFMHVYGDDPSTSTVDEGAVAGDTLRFFINEYAAKPLGPDAPTWPSENAVINVDLTAQNLDIIVLNMNWNLMSFTSIPPNDSVRAVLSSVDGKYRIVSGFDLSWGGARTYDPTLPQFSDLWHLDPFHGYWIKMNQADTLRVAGERSNTDQGLSLEVGWNLTSYLPESPLLVDKALTTISGKYSIVSGFEGGAKTYVPGSSFNDLISMKNGFGYWIRMSQGGVLNFGGPSTPPSTRLAELPSIALGNLPTSVIPTPVWTDYYGSILIGEDHVAVGELIEAYDPDGVKCGEYQVQTAGLYGFMHVYGDDPATSDVDEGARAGDAITFHYRGNAVARADDSRLAWTGDRTSRQFPFEIPKGLDEDSGIPLTCELYQNYPNPFNPSTLIRYQIPSEEVVVLKIFDILGREVVKLVDEKQKAEYRSFKEYERSFKDALPQNEQQISMNYWYPDDLPYSHPKRH